MASILISYRNHVDAAVVSGGSWSATLPVTNLADRQPSKVARTIGTDPIVTVATVDFGEPEPVRFVALINHNLTQSGRWRIRLGNDPLLASPILDTGNIDIWPAAIPFGVGEWGEFNWGGRLDADDAATYGAQAFHAIDTPVRARFLRIDLVDAGNPAGFLQAGRLVAGPAWQPSVNFQYGWSIEQVDESEIKRSLGGQAYVNVRPRYRRLRFTLDHLGKDEMFGHAYELERLKGKGGDIMVIADPDDGIHAHRHTLYGALAETAPIVNGLPGRFSRRFVVEELL
ncbi:MAG: hypothetical protein P1U88_05985 [Thalassobaculaceae bacterium]|nr:hypothetical protein [Thalassobaculaceae bacterium]